MSSSSYDSSAHREIERLTRVSCDLLRTLESCGVDFKQFSPETRQWWETHKAHDERRAAAQSAIVQREKLRTEALAKLTPEEKQALGV